MQAFEKLGAFYLGKLYDTEKQSILDDLLLYDAKDLTTHAVCVGMTGSGKTGLCVSLLEEAAIDGIPTIAIDPKGDLGNLLLTFPGLKASEFRPWIDDQEAARKGETPDQYAASVAALWKKGLAGWGQDGARIRAFRDAVDLAIYTPGSSAGRPLRVLRSFDAPPAAVLENPDALRERILSSASGLLTLLGIDADPIRSREHILLSNLLQRAWQQGRGMDLGTLIREIQSPPFERIGVMDVESFFPSRERGEFAMTLNNLLASPGFAAWMEGEPLNVQRLLWTEQGKPRISIMSIAHLSDAERMFIVTTLLNEVVTWVRGQGGTGSLRALLYMDEVFGYLPPTANPPSKTPMLTLLKQARAYGLGVVLATQNPVDLDYKALSNTGTWLLGRLQTERDKARVLDGLEGAAASAAAGFDRKQVETTLSGLKSRVFLMNNVHETEPAVFHTRWALSYLRGPLTLPQVQELGRGGVPVEAARPVAAAAAASEPSKPAAAARTAKAPTEAQRPIVPGGIAEHFLERAEGLNDGDRLLYRPALLGSARLHFVQSKSDIDQWEEVHMLAPIAGRTTSEVWEKGDSLDFDPREAFGDDPGDDVGFAKLPAAAAKATSYRSWGKSLGTFLYRTRTLPLWRCAELKVTSKPGESEGDFRARIGQLGREKRDLKVAKLEKRYGPKLARLRDQIRRAEQKVQREQSQYGSQKVQTAISVGATVLGALFGRKVTSVGTVGRATTAFRGVGRAAREKGDIARAAELLEAKVQALKELEAEFEEESSALREGSAEPELKRTDIRPRKSDIEIEPVVLVWTPWRIDTDGVAQPLWTPE